MQNLFNIFDLLFTLLHHYFMLLMTYHHARPDYKKDTEIYTFSVYIKNIFSIFIFILKKNSKKGHIIIKLAKLLYLSIISLTIFYILFFCFYISYYKK